MILHPKAKLHVTILHMLWPANPDSLVACVFNNQSKYISFEMTESAQTRLSLQVSIWAQVQIFKSIFERVVPIVACFWVSERASLLLLGVTYLFEI